MMLDPQFNELITHPPFFVVTLSTSPYLGCAIAASHYPGLKGAPLHEVYLQWGNANDEMKVVGPISSVGIDT